MTTRNWIRLLLAVLLLVSCVPLWGQQKGERPVGKIPLGKLPSPATLNGLETVSAKTWNETAVRRVLQAFAFGGHATDRQIRHWADMHPRLAISEMLNFDPVNLKLSDPGDIAPGNPGCQSLTELQAFWSSDDAANPVRNFDRSYYDLLLEEQAMLSPLGLYLVWPRAMLTRGCNLFLHKVAFYLTNYHASIHLQNSGVALIRDYYDDTLAALTRNSSFVSLMHQAARNGALAVAYGHTTNYVEPATGVFHGNDDFAREYFQLLFGIEGTTEDPDYHEGVSIENNALLLTGMFVDAEPDRFGSEQGRDWLLSTIDFTDHVDATGRDIYNRTAHFDFRQGDSSCLEILHHQICGANADAKLKALGPVAAAHPESIANTPAKIIRFFADSNITPAKAQALQTAWVDSGFDLLDFIRLYSVSTLFHSPDRFKYWSSFERNLLTYNANILDNEESFARPFFAGPVVRMYDQGALAFSPIRDVFGGQTGNDAANDRFLFKNAWGVNVDDPEALGASQEFYFLDPDGPVHSWEKDWGSVIPTNPYGEHVVGEVAEWLWQRFIADDLKNFDPVARAQVNSLLATGFDFAAVVDRNNMDAMYSSQDIAEGTVAAVNTELAATRMDFSDPEEQLRVGMAVNFISMMPYTFATGENGE